jgi:hypothetical protein
MSKVFISYSSRDKDFARKLANDLRELDHEVWLDEWVIKVGDSIVQKIEEGLSDAEFLVLILTPDAVSSGWVEREWASKYWEEVQSSRMSLLPALLRDCEIPILLRPKKYADFRESYAGGLVALANTLAPMFRATHSNTALPETTRDTRRVLAILSRTQSGATPLAVVLAEVLELAIDSDERELARYCREELAGWQKPESIRAKVVMSSQLESSPPEYRVIDGYTPPERTSRSWPSGKKSIEPRKLAILAAGRARPATGILSATSNSIRSQIRTRFSKSHDPSRRQLS